MLCGYPPFFGQDKDSIKKKILQGKLKFKGKSTFQLYHTIDEAWKVVSDNAKDLIQHMLCKEKDRYTAVECLNHRLFTENVQSLVSLSSQTLGRLK